jgi:hypothetical protein
MMELADVVAVHTVAKLVIYPGNPNVSVKIFNNYFLAEPRTGRPIPVRLIVMRY